MPERVLFSEIEVMSRLHQLRLPKDILQDVLDAAAGERANVNSSDPCGTAGLEMRRWTTRFLRTDQRVRELGWKVCRHRQIEGIRNDELKMKVAFMNTDKRTGMPQKSPASVSERGTIAELLINQNKSAGQTEMFDLPPLDPLQKYDFWYLCAFVNENQFAAELSRPIEITKGLVTDYSERIIIWQPGDKEGLVRPEPVAEDFAEIALPELKRK